MIAVEVVGPGEAKLVHQSFAAFARRQAECPTGRYGFLEDVANGHKNGAEEDLQIRTALNLDEGHVLVQLQTGLLLFRVAKQIRHDGGVVLDALAQRNGDQLTAARLGIAQQRVRLEDHGVVAVFDVGNVATGQEQ